MVMALSLVRNFIVKIRMNLNNIDIQKEMCKVLEQEIRNEIDTFVIDTFNNHIVERKRRVSLGEEIIERT